MNIGFEEIIGLIFFVFFFVMPLFTKKKGQQGGQAPRKPNAPATGGAGQGVPGTRPSATTAPQARGAKADAGASGRQPQSFREMLEEIQRRVAEAEQATQRGPAGQVPAGRQATPARPVATPTTLPPAHQGGLVSGQQSGRLVTGGPAGGQLVSGNAPSGGLGREGASAPPPESEPLQVTRRRVDSRRAVDAHEQVVRPSVRTPGGRQGARPGAATLGAPGARREPGGRGSHDERHGGVGGPAFLGAGRDDLLRGMIWHEVLSEPAALKRLRRTRSRLR
ncbi:MAG: hypothetical protein KF875_03460 [Trueperaceae bacterium]|nr:hypothetical protein [Trueperaceae bacterium]MCW5820705.1 hypothetical protein [Trueperaceae bacterium]